MGAEEEASGFADAAAELRAFAARLQELAPHGFPLRVQLVLLRTFVNGAVTHRQRARRGTHTAWAAYDTEVVSVLENWLGGPAPQPAKTLVFTPIKRGGLGFISATARCDAAFLSSWEASVDRLMLEAGAPTEAQLMEVLPLLAEQVAAARSFLRSRGALVGARRCKGRQRQLMGAVVERALRNLKGELSPVETAIWEEGCGPQGRAILATPSRSEHAMSDNEMAVTLRRRLLYDDPAGRGGQPCGHRYVGSARTCAVVLGPSDFGLHALCCSVGAGWLVRHDAIRDVWATWLRERLGDSSVQTEEYVPAWDQPNPRTGQVDRARLDILVDVPGRGRLALDISVTEAAAVTRLGSRRAPRPGAAARTREGEKHRRYPPAEATPTLIPIVYESGGRAGGEAEAFLKSLVQETESATRAEAICDLRLRLAAALHRGNASLLLSGGPGPRGWPWKG